MLREDTREFQMARELLDDNEKVGLEIVERRMGGAKLFGVAHAYATSYRIIVIRRYVLGLRKSLKIIKYSDITEVNVERGLMFCKVHFSLQGEFPEASNRKWLMGLKYKEALELMKYMDKMRAKPIPKSG